MPVMVGGGSVVRIMRKLLRFCDDSDDEGWSGGGRVVGVAGAVRS